MYLGNTTYELVKAELNTPLVPPHVLLLVLDVLEQVFGLFPLVGTLCLKLLCFCYRLHQLSEGWGSCVCVCVCVWGGGGGGGHEYPFLIIKVRYPVSYRV